MLNWEQIYERKEYQAEPGVPIVVPYEAILCECSTSMYDFDAGSSPLSTEETNKNKILLKKQRWNFNGQEKQRRASRLVKLKQISIGA